MRYYFLILIISFFGQLSYAQLITVRDVQEKPVAYAQVSCQYPGDTTMIALTDAKGAVSFAPPGGIGSRMVLEIRHLGYETHRDTLACREKYAVQLQEAATRLDPTVITAQYAAGASRDAMHKVKVIGRKTIEAMGAVHLGDVLRFAINTRISQDNVLGSSVSLQGLGGQNVKILIDGVPMIGRQNGNIDLSQINLSNVERIEVVEGPLSVNYGTDALAGAINVITRKSQVPGMEIAANSYYESAGQYNADGRWGWHKGRHQVSVSGGRNYFDGWSPTDPFIQFPKARPADSLRDKLWNAKEQYFGNFQYQFQGKKFTLRPFADVFSETITNRGLPRAPYLETAFDDVYRTWRNNVGLQGRGKIGAASRWQFSAAFNDFQRIKNSYFKDLTTLTQELTNNRGDQDTARFQLLMSRGSFATTGAGRRINFELGYDANAETAVGARIAGLSKTQYDLALYGSAEIQVTEYLEIRPGLRVAHNSAYPAPVVPSLNWKLDLPLARRQDRSLAVRGAWSRGFRAPSLKELYFEFIDINHNILGNSDLKAEHSHNFQVDVEWQQVRARKLIRTGVGAYYNRVRDLIALSQSPSGPEFTYVNIGQFQTVGVQGKLMWKWENLDLNFGAAYVGRYNLISAEQAVPGFSFSPEFQTQVQWRIPAIKGQFATFFKYTGALPGYATVDGEVVETKIQGYPTWDFSFTRQLWQQRLQWTIGGKNLLDVQNVQANTIAGGVHSPGGGARLVAWGRSVFMAFRFRINSKQ